MCLLNSRYRRISARHLARYHGATSASSVICAERVRHRQLIPGAGDMCTTKSAVDLPPGIVTRQQQAPARVLSLTFDAKAELRNEKARRPKVLGPTVVLAPTCFGARLNREASLARVRASTHLRSCRGDEFSEAPGDGVCSARCKIGSRFPNPNPVRPSGSLQGTFKVL